MICLWVVALLFLSTSTTTSWTFQNQKKHLVGELTPVSPTTRSPSTSFLRNDKRYSYHLYSSSPASTQDNKTSNARSTTKAPPRTGLAQTLLNIALKSPLWKHVMVPEARKTMVKTAEANDIPWTDAKRWLINSLNEETKAIMANDNLEDGNAIPAYYKAPFHAYDKGNLCWDAAIEVEIASRAVGARNFPEYGSKGDDAFRDAFDCALVEEAGAVVPVGGNILDMGCGTGISTRRIAANYKEANSVYGIDLSPYYISVGKQLLELEPKSYQENGDDGSGTWVSTITNDSRIKYFVGDAANTGFEPETFDVVNLQFVLHECPSVASLEIVDEALRVLKPGGQLWICEMDFESPGYAAQRANALLFSMIRSTEPYLDQYAESISDLFEYIQSKFENGVTVTAATGRHYALVAIKGKGAEGCSGGGFLNDLRFDHAGEYRVEDTHLQYFWERKQSSS